MVKILLILFFLFVQPLYPFSARDQVHQYGYAALGDDVSGIHENPATLFNLYKSYSEFMLTAEREFSFSSFYLGSYLFSFPLFHRNYPTSVNLGLGMEGMGPKTYLFSMGGTLIDFLKYGFTYKRIKGPGRTIGDLDTGLLAVLTPWLDTALSLKNLRDREADPFLLTLALDIKFSDDIILSSGLETKKEMKKIEDYSLAMDVCLVRNFYLMAGVQKDLITPGAGLRFNGETENLSWALAYDRSDKKILKYILSYHHRFGNIFIPKEKAEEGRGGKKQPAGTDKETLKAQQFYLNKAKQYFAEERLKDSKEMIQKVMDLGQKTAPAREADELLKKIRVIEKKLKEE